LSHSISVKIAGSQAAHSSGTHYVECRVLRVAPCFRHEIVSQRSVRLRRVSKFADVAERNLVRSRARNGEAYGVPVAAAGKMRTRGGISEVAEVADESVVEANGHLIARRTGARGTGRPWLIMGTAASGPSRAERQARGMRPCDVIHNFPRHEIWAGQFVLRRKAIVTRAVI
jgi:hypothetical protein